MFRIQVVDEEGHLIHRIPLGARPITFGRDPESTVTLPEINVSRNHAVIEPYGNFFILKDLGSTNGTWVNQRPVKSHIIRAGDVIQLGSHRVFVDETQRVSDSFREQSHTRILDNLFEFDESIGSGNTVRMEIGQGLFTLPGEDPPGHWDRLNRVQKIIEDISLIETPEVLYPKVLEILLVELEADRVSFLVPNDDGSLKPVAALSALDEEPEDIFEIHGGVLQRVTTDLTALLTEDATLDQRFDPGEGSRPPRRVYSVMCVPLVTNGSLHGALYLDRIHNVTPFTEEDLGLLAVTANHVAISLINANLFQDVLNEKRRVQAIIDNLHDGLVITDRRGKIEKFNVAASHMLAEKGTNLNGKDLLAMLRSMASDFDEEKLRSLGEDHEIFKLVLRSNDATHGYLMLAVPYSVADGEEGGLIFAFRDSTGFIALEHLKSEFIRTASQRLRTPLTVLLGNIELFREGVDDQNERTRLLAEVDRNLTELQRLVDRFVEFTELDRHSEPFREVALEEAINLAWAGLVIRAEEKGIRLERSFRAGSSPTCQGSMDRLIQCFSNLLDNAIRFSPQGARVAIEMEERDGVYEVRLRDEGAGVPRDHLDLIFSSFHRASNLPAGEQEGVGLGLTISRRILHAHGGELRIDSPDPESGRGTCVVVRIPRERPTTPHSLYLETDLIPTLV